MLDDFLRAGKRVEEFGDFAASVVVDGVKVDLAERSRTFAVVWRDEVTRVSWFRRAEKLGKASAPMSESRHLTVKESLMRSMQGRNCSRWIPFL